MTDLSQTVKAILDEVRKEGDAALVRYANQFDGVNLLPDELLISRETITQGFRQTSPQFRRSVADCAGRIERFAKEELRHITKSWDFRHKTTRVGQRVGPIDSVGLYIPGGRFPYPSTVLMTAIPAKVAGVRRIVMATPAKNLTPEVLAAAKMAGVTTILQAGGAGAIGAMAFGTARLQKVDFIVGPGNAYVMEAKRQVYGTVGIDSLAGPSEVVTLVDSSTPISYIQEDLMAQAEHDPEAKALLLSTDGGILEKVKEGLLPELSDRIKLCQVKSTDEAIRMINDIAPEHLELLVRQPEKILKKIRHAGAIFLGPNTPTAIGDYVAGPSHVLPTNRSARFSSGLSVATFMKRSSVIQFQAKPAENALWKAAMQIAKTENMIHHEKSLSIRLLR